MSFAKKKNAKRTGKDDLAKKNAKRTGKDHFARKKIVLRVNELKNRIITEE